MQSCYNSIVTLPYPKFTFDNVYLLSDSTTFLFGWVLFPFRFVKKTFEGCFSFYTIFSSYTFYLYTFHWYSFFDSSTFNSYTFHSYAFHSYTFHLYTFHSDTFHSYTFDSYTFLYYTFYLTEAATGSVLQIKLFLNIS